MLCVNRPLNFHWHTPHYTGRNILLLFPNRRDYARLYVTIRIHPELPPLCITQLLLCILTLALTIHVAQYA